MTCHYVQCVTCHISLLLQSQSTIKLLGSLSKSQWRWWQECHETKGIMSRTMALYVHSKALCISLSSSAKQEHEMTKFCEVWGTWAATAYVSYFYSELNTVITYCLSMFLEPLAHWADLDNANFTGKIWYTFDNASSLASLLLLLKLTNLNRNVCFSKRTWPTAYSLPLPSSWHLHTWH